MLSIIKLRLLKLRDEYLVFIIMTVMALGLTYVFGNSMSSYKPTVLIVDQDQSKYSSMIQREIKSIDQFKYETSTYDNAIKKVDSGDVLTAIVIKDGLDKDINRGRKPSLGIIKTTDNMDILVLENTLSSITNKTLGNVRIANITTEYIKEKKNDIDEENMFNSIYNKAVVAWKYNKPIEVSREIFSIEGSKGYDSLKHSVIGFSIFFSMYTIVFGIGTILYDKQYNTWQRMIISPVSKAAILGGNLIVTYLIGSLQLGVLILFGKYLFGIDWGSSILGILTVAASFVFAVTCLGLFLSGIVKTHSQLSAISPVILTSTAMLGGCMWPLDIVNSKPILFLANFTPQKWAIQGMERIATYGEGFNAAVTPSLILIGMGLIFFATGVKLVKFE